ncbi:FtsX-like permease family protein [Vibrio sp. SCSIO 43136]|uniref:ABC transporter permease n=1 Tax=Vibrio sp. SCSIO 43136 TaxID=2819101 RepID=UPI002075088C|nr:FtsX-like permease family protein [Vibrio sp. SCSIO 43136]USD67347.1 FtsX-like permease family protein [Vibrio sp. SCSIO 43136]
MRQTSHFLHHIWLSLKLFACHYRQAPLQAASILIGIVLAVTLFVAVQAINLNAKRSYSESAEQLSAQAAALVIPSSGQRHLPESVYFALRQAGVSGVLAVLEGRVRDQTGQTWSVQGSDLVAAVTSQIKYRQSNPNAGNQESSPALFSAELPLAKLLSGDALVLMSRSQYESLQHRQGFELDGMPVEIVAVPDAWQLGSRVLMDIGFAQQLLNKPGQLSYIAVFDAKSQAQIEDLLDGRAQWSVNTQSSDLGSLTDSFHLNLTAMSLLAFLVGLFIAYNGVKYSLLKRNRLLVQVQQVGVGAKWLMSALLIELAILVLIGVSLGFVLGMQLSHWLHPTVALTLEQLYGATLLPGSWEWQWWFQALVLTLLSTLLACWQFFKSQINQPLSSHGGFYARPQVLNQNRLFVLGCLFAVVAAIGLISSAHFRITMVWLGVLVCAVPLFLPKVLTVLALWCERRSRAGLIQYLFAELRELIAPLSLAMMALLLAVTANIGMNTLVGSFEHTLKQWLEQRLHADIYISPAQGQMMEVMQALTNFDGVEEVYTQYYLQEKVQGLPTLLGTKDPITLEQTMVFKHQLDNFWPRFYQGELAAISEPMAIKLGLNLSDSLQTDALKGHSIKIGAIFYDYGSPNGEMLIAPSLWQSLGFTDVPSSLGMKVNADQTQVYQQLQTHFELHSSQLYDQAKIKTIALEIFSQTFAVTSALNGVTLMVAVIGLFCACYMLLDARKASVGRLYALGVSRNKLMALVCGQITMLLAFTLVIALPLGAVIGYVLTDMITLRAFGWSLDYLWSWLDAFTIAMATIFAAVLATILPLWKLVRSPVVSSLQSEVL